MTSQRGFMEFLYEISKVVEELKFDFSLVTQNFGLTRAIGV